MKYKIEKEGKKYLEPHGPQGNTNSSNEKVEHLHIKVIIKVDKKRHKTSRKRHKTSRNRSQTKALR